MGGDPVSLFKKIYLLAYNGLLCGSWAVILSKVISAFSIHGAAADSQAWAVYSDVAPWLSLCQAAAVMEIVHAMLGIVRTPVATNCLQVGARLIVLGGSVRLLDPSITDTHWCVQMIAAWSVADIIRYLFYTLTTLGKVPAWLTWLRYSAFLVLYPIGISGEMGCMYNAIAVTAKSGAFSIALPNEYNFSFHYPTFVWFALAVLYPAGSYVMYTYMLQQRKKVLGGKKKKP
jgi:very-long-chain (3R)-3-hydroxyacyl-CoA dehydratase